MALTMDSALAGILLPATTKDGWCTLLKAALGSTRLVRCKRDASAVAPDPWTTGTEFISVGVTGTMGVTAGNISSFGVLATQTIQLAAILSTGSSILRLEGGGHYVHGSLGLDFAAQRALGTPAGNEITYDFMLPANPTTTSGIGFLSSCRLNAPANLSSGIGPGVPALTANAPHTVEVWNYTVPSSPVLQGAPVFDNRVADFSFTDTVQASIMGDIGIYLSSTSVVYGTHEFGFMMLVSAASNTEAGVNPLYEVLRCAVPYGQWSGYPSSVGFALATVDNFLPPLKLVIKNLAGGVLGTVQWPGGEPVNSAAVPGVLNISGSFSLKVNTAQMSIWRSERVSVSPRSSHLNNGIDSRSFNAAMSKNPFVGNGTYPAITGTASPYNGNAALWSMPQYPLSTTATQTQDDLYLYDINSGNYPGIRWHGWRYVEGQPNGWDWFTGTGGTREDRAAYPSVLALFLTDPTFVRLQGSVPIRDMVENWYDAAFNCSYHYIPTANVKTFAGPPDAEMLDGVSWGYWGAYYNAGPFGTKSIPLLSIWVGESQAEVNTYHHDKNGRLLWNGFSQDELHNYNHPGVGLLHFNDPALLITHKFKVLQSFMCGLGSNTPTGDPRVYWLIREHAWRMENYTLAWALASDHYLGLKRSDIEARWKIELENEYDKLVQPISLGGEQGFYADGIRNLGSAANYQPWTDGTNSVITSLSGGLGFYMSGVLMYTKQTGAWDRMRSLSAKCAATLDYLMLCLNKASIDYMCDTKGRIEDFSNSVGYITHGNFYLNGTTPHTYASWAAHIAANPRVGVEDWIHDTTGARIERGSSAHPRAMHPYVLKHYFPEITYPRRDTAIALYDAYFDVVQADIAAEATVGLKRTKAFDLKYPALGTPRAPVAYP